MMKKVMMERVVAPNEEESNEIMREESFCP